MRSGLSDDGVVLLAWSVVLTQVRTMPTKRERGLMALVLEHAVHAFGLLSTPSGVRDEG